MADTFNTVMAAADSVLLDALGETVTVKNTSDVAVGSVVGVFDRQFVEVNDLQGYYPTFTYKEADLAISTGYEITIDSQAYNVRYPMPDGTGMSMLVLGEK